MPDLSPVPWMDDSLLDVLPLPACICEATSGRIIGCNPQAAALWGHQPGSEGRIHDVLRFVHPDGTLLPPDESPFAAAPQPVEVPAIRPAIIERGTGGALRVSINIVPLKRADGTVDTRLLVIQNAIDRSRDTLLQGQSRILEMIAHGAPLPTIVNTITGIIEADAAGAAVAAVMLLSPDGRRLSHAGAPALPDLFKQRLDAVDLGPHAGTCAVAAWRRRPVQTEDIGDAPEWIGIGDAGLTAGFRAAWAMPIISSSKRLLGAFGLYFRERRAITADERAAVELLAGVAAIAIERQHAADAVLESDRRRDEFLAMLAHELRNPLAPIRTAAQLLGLSEGGSLVTAKVQGVIERQVSNLTRIIDDLLDVSRVTRGAITLHTAVIDAAAVAARAVECAAPFIEKRDHRLTVSSPPDPVFVRADPGRLEQVIFNLLVNAAKFTSRGGAISVRIAGGADTATITVTDNGRGIAAALLPYVFDMFIQGSRTLDRSEGGLGIGLTVAHRLMEMHGGSIAVRSEGPGFGSQFTLTLPRERTPAAAAPGDAGHSASGRKILVVEDRPDAAEMLALLLRAQAHEVRVALDGHAALVAAAEFHPDVMLIDIGLPGMSGYDLAERIRRDQALASVSLVAVTGYGGVQDRRHALSCGFDEHLLKPIDHQALAELLEASPRRMRRAQTASSRSSWVIEPDLVE